MASEGPAGPISAALAPAKAPRAPGNVYQDVGSLVGAFLEGQQRRRREEEEKAYKEALLGLEQQKVGLAEEELRLSEEDLTFKQEQWADEKQLRTSELEVSQYSAESGRIAAQGQAASGRAQLLNAQSEERYAEANYLENGEWLQRQAGMDLDQISRMGPLARQEAVQFFRDRMIRTAEAAAMSQGEIIRGMYQGHTLALERYDTLQSRQRALRADMVARIDALGNRDLISPSGRYVDEEGRPKYWLQLTPEEKMNEVLAFEQQFRNDPRVNMPQFVQQDAELSRQIAEAQEAVGEADSMLKTFLGYVQRSMQIVQPQVGGYDAGVIPGQSVPAAGTMPGFIPPNFWDDLRFGQMPGTSVQRPGGLGLGMQGALAPGQDTGAPGAPQEEMSIPDSVNANLQDWLPLGIEPRPGDAVPPWLPRQDSATAPTRDRLAAGVDSMGGPGSPLPRGWSPVLLRGVQRRVQALIVNYPDSALRALQDFQSGSLVLDPIHPDVLLQGSGMTFADLQQQVEMGQKAAADAQAAAASGQPGAVVEVIPPVPVEGSDSAARIREKPEVQLLGSLSKGADQRVSYLLQLSEAVNTPLDTTGASVASKSQRLKAREGNLGRLVTVAKDLQNRFNVGYSDIIDLVGGLESEAGRYLAQYLQNRIPRS